MFDSIIQRSVEDNIRNGLSDKALVVFEKVNDLAEKQGQGNAIDNYRALGKKALIGVVATVAVVQIVGFAVSRKAEERRIEKIVRRVVAEERRQAEQAQTNQ